KTALTGVADIHVRALAHALEAFEFLNFGGVIDFGAGLIVCQILRVGSVGHVKIGRDELGKGKSLVETDAQARVFFREKQGVKAANFAIRREFHLTGRGTPTSSAAMLSPVLEKVLIL